MRHTMMHYELTVTSMFRRAATHHVATDIVSRRPEGSLERRTFANFDRSARQLASALRRAGAHKSDRVAALTSGDRP